MTGAAEPEPEKKPVKKARARKAAEPEARKQAPPAPEPRREAEACDPEPAPADAGWTGPVPMFLAHSEGSTLFAVDTPGRRRSDVGCVRKQWRWKYRERVSGEN